MRNQILQSPDALDLASGMASPEVAGLQTYLGRFGWLRLDGQEAAQGSPAARSGVFDEATESALTGFQRFYRLPADGRLNAQTLELIHQPRCGVPDNLEAIRFAPGPTKWDKLNLGFRLSKGTSDLVDADVNHAVAVAYRHWCLVSKMVVHRSEGEADVDVRFETGEHGDNNPFDGVGTVLAHAFYPPPNGGAIAGDMHFDDAETWTRDIPPGGIDLDTVSLHEAGHALGLDHSADPTAVMYAFYGGPRRALTADDIAGIRSLYGERNRTVWADIDAAIEGEGSFVGKAYMFKGADYLRYDYSDDLPDVGYPFSTSAAWGLPSAFAGDLDAAVNGQGRYAGKAYFFEGNEYMRYDWAADRIDPGYPKPIAAEWGMPYGFRGDLDAAVTGKGPFTGKAYFFKGGDYVRYDWGTERIDTGYPKSIAAEWRGLPAEFTTGIQAAMNGQKTYDGKLYLFKGRDYVRYDWTSDHTDPGYPLSIEFHWL